MGGNLNENITIFEDVVWNAPGVVQKPWWLCGNGRYDESTIVSVFNT